MMFKLLTCLGRRQLFLMPNLVQLRPQPCGFTTEHKGLLPTC